nr:gaf domain nucleotide-binding protein [Colletotrichum truncatum]KAF6801484.1 gaf domain nucleotide-binding protein [Colletotrichum truncatum]
MAMTQVHADASNFASGVTKDQAYEQVLLQAEGLFYEQRNWIWYVQSLHYHSVKFSTLKLLITKTLKQPFQHGLTPLARLPLPPYPLSKPKPEKPSLILGPFQGKVACQTIPFGRGVCGAAASTRETQLVPDVDAFPGHIACDGDSKSEIVVPIVVDGKLVAIIDIDCAEVNGFDEVDKAWLEKLAALLAKSSDW